MTGPSTTEPPRTRERILDAALTLFADRGYEATSMREIAMQLGITKAALYYHFENKADIVRSLLVDIESQVAGLVQWTQERAQGQPATPGLRREVLERWSDILQAHGLTAFRFVVANRQVVHDTHLDQDGMHQHLNELFALLAPADASVEDQLRIRLALMSINMAGLAGSEIAAPEAEVLAAARRLALEVIGGC